MTIHATAIIDRTAEIDPTAEVGAYAVIEGGVQIGPQTRIYPQAYIAGGTRLGRVCQIHPFAVVGHHPQDLAWERSPSYTVVGDETVIREHATIHRERQIEKLLLARQILEGFAPLPSGEELFEARARLGAEDVRSARGHPSPVGPENPGEQAHGLDPRHRNAGALQPCRRGGHDGTHGRLRAGVAQTSTSSLSRSA